MRGAAVNRARRVDTSRGAETKDTRARRRRCLGHGGSGIPQPQLLIDMLVCSLTGPHALWCLGSTSTDYAAHRSFTKAKYKQQRRPLYDTLLDTLGRMANVDLTLLR